VPGKLEFENAAPPPKPDVSIFDLLNAVSGVLQRFNKRENLGDIFEDKWAVSEKIDFILKMISGRPSVRFVELFAGAASRTEVICTFLALLELIRLRQLVCAQPEPFAEIEISRAAPATGAPVPAPPKLSSEGGSDPAAAPEPVAQPPSEPMAAQTAMATGETGPKIEDSRQS
jgi:segregation and condensation protein A